jgi:methylated-DNA-[protein]-cysteine S-methyltransferase
VLHWSCVPSPVGPLGVATTPDGLVAIRFGGPPGPVDGEPPADLATQLAEYFEGTRTVFTLGRAAPGGSTFERAVWERIAAIPYGETVTYGRIAAEVGEPDAAGERRLGAASTSFAARAVGLACNRNPLPVVVPCHRVVGAGNKLVGFGGGLPRKRYLLELEARVWIEQAFRSGSPT